jgi:dipeptidyl aminopeptidase/acylaminoacyl peptidase
MSEKRQMPDAPSVPDGPTIQENTGKALAAPTFQDLLKNAYDEKLFDYFMQSRLVRVSLDGKLTPLGTAGLIASLSPSPNAKFLLVETLHRPFSYLVPAGRFPMKIDVMDMTGKVVKELADLPLAEDVGIGRDAERKGVRNAAWRADAPATLVWAEVQDGGDAKSKAEIRDKVFMLAEPFTGQPQTLISLEFRFRGMTWSEQGFALVNEFWWQSRKARTWLVKPSEKPDLIFDRSSEDRYNAPGTPVTKLASNGETVLHTVDGGKSIFLVGDGASPDGDKPFMDKFDLTVKKTERLWRSEAPYYELPVDILDDAGKVVLTSRESVSEPPNYFIRNLDKKTMTQFTSFTNPAAALSKASKELIKYKRDDGVELSATLYLPEGYDAKKDGALPMLMWAYPQEFKSAAAASQIIGSPYRFVRINWGSPLYWLTQGYAILDGPTMPIVGEGNKEPNDTYVQQLVSSAKAAVDEVVRRGVADPKRIAIGGHSYGAFMTANLLAHSDLFRAGIARSGAYNRTLTPFGFQAEERTFWQAPDTYMKMSPFMNADKINEPILLIHGEADNNTGTFPIQSERFYNALKGLGKTARLVMLPFESHGYQGRESVMHTLYEMHEWLERYVKKAETKTTAQ